MKRIAIFASGSGSNAENIINHFNNTRSAIVTKVYCNKKGAKVFERCKRLNIESVLFSKDDFFKSEKVLKDVIEHADYIVLAGFLWKIPSNLITAFPNKIINIHPALLPKYGGKGMYGMHVHNAVKENKEAETGITIHYVNENYDEGAIIFQATTILEPSDSAENIAEKIHVLEYEHFPKVIAQVIQQ